MCTLFCGLISEEGASKDPCSDQYCGPKAFSEVEVKGVADFIMANAKTMKGFIDFHSYSQLWMSPWGYTKELPPDFQDQVKQPHKCNTVHRLNLRYKSTLYFKVQEW